MTTKRTGYLMAMLAGLAIVGASTGGVVAATSHHDIILAAEQSGAAAALESSAAASVSVSPSPVSAPTSPGPASAAAGVQSDAATSAATRSSSTRSHTTSGTVVPAPPATTPSRNAAAPANASSSSQASPASPTTSKAAAPTNAGVALKYKNGQYTATGSYDCPSGTEKIGVTITLASDKVVSANLDLLGGAGLSHSFQASFQSGYSPQVIGKDIGSVSVGTVSGSSLTSAGFNDALKQIESQAKT